MRRIAVKDFGNRAHSGLQQVALYVGDQPPPLSSPALPAHAHGRGDVGAEEPGPDGALMIGAVALPLIPIDVAAISRIVGSERSQSDRREQLLFADPEHGLRTIAIQQREWQR